MSSLKDEAAYRPHHTCRAADRDTSTNRSDSSKAFRECKPPIGLKAANVGDRPRFWS